MKSRSLHYDLKKQEEINRQSETNDTKREEQRLPKPTLMRERGKAKQTTLKRGTTTSKTDANEKKRQSKTNNTKERNNNFQNQRQREKEANSAKANGTSEKERISVQKRQIQRRNDASRKRHTKHQ